MKQNKDSHISLIEKEIIVLLAVTYKMTTNCVEKPPPPIDRCGLLYLQQCASAHRIVVAFPGRKSQDG